MVQPFALERATSPSGTCLLTVTGELDIVTSPKLVVAGREALRSGASRISVNLTDVTFMDSGGLAALINLHRSAERAHGRLTVVCPDGAVRRLFAISGTEAMFGLARDAAAA
jgi:anti-sigma B factor antagonist